MEDDAHAWQSAISILRSGAHLMLSDEVDPRREEHAEDLLHQARTLISESAQRRYTRIHLQQTQNEEAMGRLTARLLSSLDEEQIYATLRDHLPLVGIRSGSVAFFEPREGDPTGGSRLRTYQPDAPQMQFTTREFPPQGLFREDEPFNLALLPLVFQEEKLGYVVFDGENLNPLATVVRQLASAVKSAELHAKVLELSLTDALTGVHNRRFFEILLQKEVERSQRYNRPLATIMIDIDHFKRYNDSSATRREMKRCDEWRKIFKRKPGADWTSSPVTAARNSRSFFPKPTRAAPGSWRKPSASRFTPIAGSSVK